MTEAQAAELRQTLSNSITSNTIEWSLNLRVCDILQANPSLTPEFMHQLKLTSSSPVKVLLSLSVLEMVVKNLGVTAARCIDVTIAERMTDLVKKKEGWKYSIGRNLHKSGLSGWLASSAGNVGIGENERAMWQQATQKVLEMLQLWVDAFLLQEGQLRALFDAYKLLRQEGYKFPDREQGSAAELLLVHGAEESPVLLAGIGGVPPGERSPTGGPAPEPTVAEVLAPPEPTPAAPAPAEPPMFERVATLRQLLADLPALEEGSEDRTASLEQLGRERPWVERLVHRQLETAPSGHDDEAQLDEAITQGLLGLLEDLDTVLGPPASAHLSEAAEPAADLVDIGAGEQSAPSGGVGGEGGAACDDIADPVLAEVASISLILAAVLGQDEPTPSQAARVRSAHAWVTRQIERHFQDEGQLTEMQLQSLLSLLEEVNAVNDRLPAPTISQPAASSEPASRTAGGRDAPPPPPPPPSGAMPTREEQEEYDLILARYLQDRENEQAQPQSVDDDAALAMRLSMEDAFGGAAYGAAHHGHGAAQHGHGHAQQAQVLCARCGTANGLGASAGPQLFQCYTCGMTQRSPGRPQPVAHQQPTRPIPSSTLPTRHAPPPRVICVDGATPELLISTGAPGAAATPIAATPASDQKGAAGGIEGESIGEALLGAPVSKNTKAWKKASWTTGLSGSKRAATPGDGSRSQYMDLGDEGASSLLGGGEGSSERSGAGAASGAASFLDSWRGARSPPAAENEESLLERVQVDDEWELIRTPDQAPYWHNLVTRVTQWKPPSVVATSKRRQQEAPSDYAPL